MPHFVKFTSADNLDTWANMDAVLWMTRTPKGARMVFANGVVMDVAAAPERISDDTTSQTDKVLRDIRAAIQEVDVAARKMLSDEPRT